MDIIHFYNKLINKNILNKIIGINIIVYLLGLLLPYSVVMLFMMPTPLDILIKMPWSFVTSVFIHNSFSHILWNMVFLYIFGDILLKYINNKEFLKLYIYSAFFANIGILLYGLIFSVGAFSLGASGAISGIMAATIYLNPNKKISMILFDIKMKHIMWYFVISNIFGLFGSNCGGSIAHLVGLGYGYVWIKNYQNRNILSDMFKFI